jgi:uncharacterized spore protein YtfJ
MKLTEFMTTARDSLSVQRVFAEPLERDGVTVIAAANVRGVAPGPTATPAAGEQGEGGGFGVMARPAGAFVVKDGQVAWRPAVDVNRLVAAGAAVVIAYLVTRSWTARAQLKAGRRSGRGQ